MWWVAVTTSNANTQWHALWPVHLAWTYGCSTRSPTPVAGPWPNGLMSDNAEKWQLREWEGPVTTAPQPHPRRLTHDLQAGLVLDRKFGRLKASRELYLHSAQTRPVPPLRKTPLSAHLILVKSKVWIGNVIDLKWNWALLVYCKRRALTWSLNELLLNRI